MQQRVADEKQGLSTSPLTQFTNTHHNHCNTKKTAVRKGVHAAAAAAASTSTSITSTSAASTTNTTRTTRTAIATTIARTVGDTPTPECNNRCDAHRLEEQRFLPICAAACPRQLHTLQWQ